MKIYARKSVADWFTTNYPVMRLATQVGRLPDGNVRDVLAYGTDLLHVLFECGEYDSDATCLTACDAFSYSDYSGELNQNTLVARLIQRPYTRIVRYLPSLQPSEAPRYEHDCDDCITLGRYEQYDLYVCPDEPTVIARSSSEGSDYVSGLVFSHGSGYESLRIARERAEAEGLLSV